MSSAVLSPYKRLLCQTKIRGPREYVSFQLEKVTLDIVVKCGLPLVRVVDV
jgi:hypothetical protein